LFGVAAFYPRAGVADMKGDANSFTRSSDEGFDVTFSFCPSCGSTVFWEPARLPDVIAIAVGSFADPTFTKPDQSVKNETRHLWLELPVGLKNTN